MKITSYLLLLMGLVAPLFAASPGVETVILQEGAFYPTKTVIIKFKTDMNPKDITCLDTNQTSLIDSYDRALSHYWKAVHFLYQEKDAKMINVIPAVVTKISKSTYHFKLKGTPSANSTFMVVVGSGAKYRRTLKDASNRPLKMFHKEYQIKQATVNFVHDLAIDQKGNIGLTGIFKNAKDLGDAFVALLSKDGELKWKKVIKGSDVETGNGIVFDKKGALYITGQSDGDVIKTRDRGNVFVAKWDQNGERKWFQKYGTDKTDEGLDLAIDAKNRLILAGQTSGSLDDQKISKKKEGFCFDMFVTWFTIKGKKIRTRQFGSKLGGYSVAEYPKAVATDQRGNVYLTGVTYNNLAGIKNKGGIAAYLVKYNGNGKRLWTKLEQKVSERTFGHSVATYKNKIYLSGRGAQNNACRFIVAFNSKGKVTKRICVDKDQKYWYKGIYSNVVATKHFIYVTGRTGKSGDMIVAQFNRKTGEEIWEKIVPYSEAAAMGVTPEGDIVVAVNERPKTILIKFNPSGEKIWEKSFVIK